MYNTAKVNYFFYFTKIFLQKIIEKQIPWGKNKISLYLIFYAQP